MKNLIGLFIIICVFSTKLIAQGTYYCSINYSYDNAGNRTHSEYVCQNSFPSYKKPNTDSAVLKSILFPNPNQGVFTVSTTKHVENASIKVIDISGRVLKQFSFTGTQQNYDIRSFANGQYYIQFDALNQKEIHKMIKLED